MQGFRDLIEDECGFVKLQVSRIDLFADFQGWDLSGDQRGAFVCRADDVGLFEANGALTGPAIRQAHVGHGGRAHLQQI